MKIDGSQMADSLLQRMQQANRAPEVESTTSVGSEEKTFSVGELQSAGPAAPTKAAEPSALETELRATAERALRGEYNDAQSLRAEVVEHILRDRWEAKVGRAKTAKMIRTLKPTLVEDPEFARQVDEMLIMAARELGSSGSH